MHELRLVVIFEGALSVPAAFTSEERETLEALLCAQLDADAPDTKEFLGDLASGFEGRRVFLADLEGLHLSDLKVAWGCERGFSTSLVEFDAMLQTTIPTIASRGLSPGEIDDVLQATRVRLIVADVDERPRIGQYSGRGRLGGFIRATVIRLALNARRSEKTAASVVSQLQLLFESSHEPQLTKLKEKYLEEFRVCLAQAWETLPQHEQRFLRHQLEDRLSIDQLSEIYDIHRATAARRLVSAKHALVKSTRENLQKTLGISERDVSSILRLIETRLGLAVDAIE